MLEIYKDVNIELNIVNMKKFDTFDADLFLDKGMICIVKKENDIRCNLFEQVEAVIKFITDCGNRTVTISIPDSDVYVSDGMIFIISKKRK